MVVQHNMQAMNANRMLNVTTTSQSKSTEKLSSGYRINRAADDAAGLSISEKMRKQIKGLDQASTNAQDGVSAVQTAEGALTEVHSMLQRMNELAVQAANGTNSQSDRDAIQDEIDQLTTEIDRVSETTKFNEIYLLKGDEGTKVETMEAHDAGLKGKLTDNTDGTAVFQMDELNYGDSVTIGGKNYTIGKSNTELKNMIDTEKAGSVTIDGETYIWDANGTNIKDSESNAVADVNTLLGKIKGGSSVTIAGKSYTAMVDAAGGADGNELAAGNTTLTTIESAIAVGNVVKFTPDGGAETAWNVAHDSTVDGSTAITATKAAELANEAQGTTAKGSFKITKATSEVANTLSFNLHVGADADMTNKSNVNIETMNSSYLGIKDINVSDDSGKAATYAIDAIADAVAKVSSQRSARGAVQNRLEHTINNLDNVVENTTSAESRIRDTDMAEEMVEYSKNNILAQAGQSMLAQANQANQGVLSLFG